MRAAYLGHDFFIGCLEALLEEGFEVVRIFSARPSTSRRSTAGIQRLGRRERIGVHFRRITTSDLHDLHAHGVTHLVSAAYPYKIPIEGGPIPFAVNVHNTLLPLARGPWSGPQLIVRECAEAAGVTVHKLVSKLDAGDILAQRGLDLGERETLESLSCRMQIEAKSLMGEIARNFERYWSEAVPQGAAGSYWRAPTWEQRTIPWERGIAEIERLVRAYGKAGTLASWEGREWVVEDVSAWPERHDHEVGSVVHRTPDEIVIAAADGLVCVRSFETRLRQRMRIVAKLGRSYVRSVAAIGDRWRRPR